MDTDDAKSLWDSMLEAFDGPLPNPADTPPDRRTPPGHPPTSKDHENLKSSFRDFIKSQSVSGSKKITLELESWLCANCFRNKRIIINGFVSKRKEIRTYCIKCKQHRGISLTVIETLMILGGDYTPG